MWVTALSQHRRQGHVHPSVRYAHRVKHDRRRRWAEVHHRIGLGAPAAFRPALGAFGLSGRLHTACLERLHLAIRRSSAGLAPRSRSSAPSFQDLARPFEWGQARFAYHYLRPPAGLRPPLPDPYAAVTANAIPPRPPASRTSVGRGLTCTPIPCHHRSRPFNKVGDPAIQILLVTLIPKRSRCWRLEHAGGWLFEAS